MKGFKNLSDSCDPVGNPETIKVPSQIKTEGPIKNFWACPCPLRVWLFFSCEEAALEVQMSMCPSVRVSVRVSPELNITKVRLFEVYTKAIDCTN